MTQHCNENTHRDASAEDTNKTTQRCYDSPWTRTVPPDQSASESTVVPNMIRVSVSTRPNLFISYAREGGLTAPQAITTLSASHTVPSSHTTPTHLVPLSTNKGLLNVPFGPNALFPPNRLISRPTEAIVSTASTHPEAGDQRPCQFYFQARPTKSHAYWDQSSNGWREESGRRRRAGDAR